MRAFVSGQLDKKESVREVYAKLNHIGIDITHDWTRTEDLPVGAKNSPEAKRRAELDINGVLNADIYILMTDNTNPGKGMYVELGAALALASFRDSPKVFVVGPLNHESIFYHHPKTQYFKDIDSCIAHIKEMKN